MKGDKVLIIEGEYKDKTGIIIDVYYGLGFEQYTVLLDNSEDEVEIYHDAIQFI